MLKVEVNRDEIHFGASVTVRFMRTPRIPDDGEAYPQPQDLGTFPIFCVGDYPDRVPAAWRVRGGVFIPLYPREAIWISFSGRWWKPNAIKVGVGRINALTGHAWHERLTAEPQNYLVCPDQTRLDGFNRGNGALRQFIAMPLETGGDREMQTPGREECSGIHLMVFEPKAGRFPSCPPEQERETITRRSPSAPENAVPAPQAGGRMRQEISPDEYGFDNWDPLNYGRVCVHTVNTRMFREITGREPPSRPGPPAVR
jgi:hypothetical protein